MDACEVSGNCRRRFDQERLNFFHYILYAHARAKPKEPCVTGTDAQRATCRATNPDFHIPGTSTGVSDFLGGDGLVTLGAWGDFVGSEFVVASTTMHELGHSFGRGHGGELFDLNCKPNYLSVQNYLFQLTGLRDDLGVPHLDYSRTINAPLGEVGIVDGSSAIHASLVRAARARILGDSWGRLRRNSGPDCFPVEAGRMGGLRPH
jgi:hypothetical protein